MITKQIVQLLFLLMMIGLAACGGGQAPVASKAISRAVINSGDIVPAENIRVAEYLQYYEQHFPEPNQGAVGLDVRLGNGRLPRAGGLSWLQIGLQTKSAERELVAPLNLALVIDRSGSMADADKMPYLKQSLKIFLESLKSEDMVAIVTYSNNAELLLPAQNVGDGQWIQSIIERIQPDGSTNLQAGLMLGLQEVEKNFNVRRNNRVILLTDGLANMGVTDPERIAADALAYNKRGIYLSTIGLGLNFNDKLLVQLAKQGQGGYTFVDSAAEMDRVFREHVSSMKQQVASQVSLTIRPGANVRLIGLTGLDSAPPAEGATIPLWPLGTADSTVILAQLQVSPMQEGLSLRPLAEVEVSYFDEATQQPVTLKQSVTAEMVESLPNYDPTWDLEVLRNVTIQRTAEGMKEIDRQFKAAQYESAWRLAVTLEQQLSEVSRLTHDQQMQDDAALMQKYQHTLADAVWQTQNHAPQLLTNDSANSRPYRSGETPALPTVEIR